MRSAPEQPLFPHFGENTVLNFGRWFHGGAGGPPGGGSCESLASLAAGAGRGMGLPALPGDWPNAATNPTDTAQQATLRGDGESNRVELQPSQVK